ncbi:MAG TPA: lanthionine synthetase C family protein [Thermoanaerobaculia bacterium]|jgi:lantibiotic modifying enzyme|nr:lanthionine synthetase C family protein [Thermoanaerobaculia bacterium]
MADRDPADGWRPLLSGEAADQARAAIEEIAGELRTKLALGGMFQPAHFSLLDGYAGIALFFAYLHLISARRDDRDFAMEILDRAIEGVVETVAAPSLYAGFCGVGWVIEHLRDLIPHARFSGARMLARELNDELQGKDWDRSFDLLHGIVGIGVYGLERQPEEGAAEWLAAVIGRLATTAERSPAGAAWRVRQDVPYGAYDLGVAHGQAGAIAFLGAAYAAGAAPAQARKLARRSISWLLAHKLPAGASSIFPRSFDPLGAAQPSRLAWCSGDLGIAVALLSAARHTGQRTWEGEALALARHSAARREELEGTRDACLCHGTAGIAHLFNRLFHATGEPAFDDAARFWIERTFILRRPGEGIAGFPSWGLSPRGEPGWRSEPGFLHGAAGVGLALLAAVSPVEPAWDRVMLLSLPRTRKIQHRIPMIH